MEFKLSRGVSEKIMFTSILSYPPKLSISDMVRIFQGRLLRKIQDEFPQLGKVYWGKHFWAIGYAAFS